MCCGLLKLEYYDLMFLKMYLVGQLSTFLKSIHITETLKIKKIVLVQINYYL